MKLILNSISAFRYTLDEPIKTTMNKEVRVLDDSDQLSILTKSLKKHDYVVVRYLDGSYSIAEAKHLLELISLD
jgi:hypothetical protein